MVAVALVRTVAWGLALVAATITGARWLDIPWTPLVVAQSLSPAAVPLALLAVIGLAPHGRRGARIVLAGLCAAVLAVQAALWLPWLTAETPRRGHGLTVMTVNLYGGRANTAAVSHMVRAQGVDVLAVSELSRDAADGLRRSGIDDLLPHAVTSANGSSNNTALLSRLPLHPVRASSVPGALVRGQAARLPTAPGVIVCAVHPPTPVRGQTREWRSAQDELTAWAGRTRGPAIVAGDFNASADHPGMRQLQSTGLRDAHEVAGAGRPLTWPHGRTLPPFVQIDHVLVRGLDVESVTDVRVPGSDHDAVVAHLVVPAR